MGEHTPGSWSPFEYEGQIHIISDGDCISVAVMAPAHESDPHLPRPSEHRANVSLIAAAPHLLQALQNLEAEISSRFDDDRDMSNDLRAVIIPAREAISNAEPSLLDELAALHNREGA